MEGVAGVMFDRLDEAFQHDRDLERAALKGLLRAHLDICSYGTPLRTKLFLRTDVLHRVTEGSGFVNATHIRTQRISWDTKSIVDLVSKRIVDNETFRTTFGIEANQIASEVDRRSVVTRVLPAEMESLDIFSFVIQRTVDASDEPNPRNVITVLRLARQSQLRICDRDDPEYGLYGSLIGQDAMKAAMKELSSTRLEDTLFAEFHQLRPYVEKLKGRSFIYTREELASVLSLSLNEYQFSRLVEDLKYSGFMRESGSGQLSVPILYRPALHLYSGRLKSHTENPRTKELQALAFERAEEALVTGVDQQLEPMAAADRMVVHVAVQKMPGVVAESIGEGPERRVVIRRARPGEPASTGEDDSQTASS